MAGRSDPITVPAPRVHPHRRLRMVAVAATATTFVLVGVGGLVRATGSGLGCPGWPRCFGRLIPPIEYHAVIEYMHRLVASVALILILALAAVAWRGYRHVRPVLVPSLVAVVVVLVQAGLGAVVVEGELDPLMVTAHFAAAMVLVAVLVRATVAAYTIDRPALPFPVRGLARVAAGATFALLLLGAYVRAEGAGLTFGDWPLMDGSVIPALGSPDAVLHFAHRVLAVAVGGVVAALTVRAWRELPRRKPVAVLAATAAGMFLAQALVGAANVWTALAPAAVVAHVSLAALTWGAVVATEAAAGSTGPDGSDR